MYLYSVHDKASNTYINPLTMPTDRDAVEGFRVVCNDEKTNYYKFPADFTLVKLGMFDNRTAKIELLDEKEIIVNAAALKKNLENKEIN